jgi:hypothetical protein
MPEHFGANAVRAGIVHSSQRETIRAAASIVANAAIKVIAVKKATAVEELAPVQTFSPWGRFPRPAA